MSIAKFLAIFRPTTTRADAVWRIALAAALTMGAMWRPVTPLADILRATGIVGVSYFLLASAELLPPTTLFDGCRPIWFLRFSRGFAYLSLISLAGGLTNTLSTGLFAASWVLPILRFKPPAQIFPRVDSGSRVVFVVVLFFVGVAALAAALPQGNLQWFDIQKYYGFLVRYFAQHGGIAAAGDLLPTYSLFPQMPAFFLAAQSIVFGERAALLFAAGLNVLLALAMYQALCGLKIDSRLSSLIALAQLASVAPIFYDNSPFHPRMQEGFWLGCAALAFLEFRAGRRAAAVDWGLGLGMASASSYSSLVPVFFFLLSSLVYCGEKTSRRWVLGALCTGALIGAIWYLRVWYISGSPIGFTNFKPEWISPEHLTEGFRWRQNSCEPASQFAVSPWSVTVGAMITFLFRYFPFVFLTVCTLLPIERATSVKRAARVLAGVYFGTLIFDYFFNFRVPDVLMNQRRLFYPMFSLSALAAAPGLDGWLKLLPRWKLLLFSLATGAALLPFALDTPGYRLKPKLVAKYLVGRAAEGDYLTATMADPSYLAANRLRELGWVPGEGVVTNLNGIGYYLPAPVHSTLLSRLVADNLDRSDDEMLARLKIANARWYVLDTQFWVYPYHDGEYGYLTDLFSPVLHPLVLRRLRKVSVIQMPWWQIRIYRLDFNEPPGAIPEDLQILETVYEDIQRSEFATWRRYAAALRVEKSAPFRHRYSIDFERETISSNQTRFTAKASFDEVYLLRKVWPETPPRQPNEVQIVTKDGRVLARQRLTGANVGTQTLHFRWAAPVREILFRYPESAGLDFQSATLYRINE